MNKLTSRLSNFPRIHWLCLFVSLFIPPLSPLYSQIDTLWTRQMWAWRGNSAIETSDGGYLLVGTHGWFSDVYIGKTDILGNLLWERLHGGEDLDWARDVCEGHDGGYYVVGTWGWNRLYLLRLDEDGDTLWTRVYWDYLRGMGIAPTSDGNYVIMTWGYELLKVDPDGEIIWSRDYRYGDVALGYDVEEMREGGYVLVGYTDKYYDERKTDFYIVRVDSMGDTLWTRVYGGDRWDYAYDICETRDGGFMVLGWTYGEGCHLVKLDSIGNLIWDRVYGEMGYGVVETDDGGFMIVGHAAIPDAGFALLLIRVDSLGNELWRWRVGGETSSCEGYSIYRTMDGGYIIGGKRAGGAWLVKTTPELGVEEGGSFNPFRLVISPNPSRGMFDVDYSLSKSGILGIHLYDASGRRVKRIYEGYKTSGIHHLRVDFADLSSGIYFLQLCIGKDEVIRKIILLR